MQRVQSVQTLSQPASDGTTGGTLMTDKELKSCPFCRVGDVIIRRGFTAVWGRHNHFFQGVCEGCGCQGPRGTTPDDAREKWNNRQEGT